VLESEYTPEEIADRDAEMSRAESDAEAALLAQADEYRAGLMSRADGVNAGAPWWYGWVIVEAYLAGYRAAKGEADDAH
jgi:hypothetical protein